MTDASRATHWAQVVLAGEEAVPPRTLNLHVLDQDQIWVDETGHVHLLAQIDETYLVNILNFLLSHAQALQRRLAIARVCDLLEAVEENHDPIEIAHIAVLAIDLLEQEDPATWLRATPLAAAIINRLARTRPGSPA